MQKISDAPVRQCPQCFENTAVRLVSAAGFQLKGSGWYVTDFKNNKKSETKKETTTDTKAEGSKTTDTKATTGTKGGSE